jgi:hypothetical protein
MAGHTRTDLPRGMRRLVIRGETWGWRFGRDVPIVAPDGRRFRVDLRDLTGLDWYEIERGTHKRYFSAEPQRIVSYIDRTLLGYTDGSGFPRGVLPRDWRPELRRGWVGIHGPRGLWQWRPHPWMIQLRSPEDVSSEARIYHLLGMSVEEWADMKAAAIVAAGSTVDDELRRTGENGTRTGVEGFFGWEGPGLPVPTDRQVLAYIGRMVEGTTGRQDRREAA